MLNFFTVLSTCLVLQGLSLARAQTDVPQCSQMTDVQRDTEHFRCRSSKGHVFERVHRFGFGEAWKSPSGAIWSDLMPGLYHNCQNFAGRRTITETPAAAICQRYSSNLPTYEDYDNGEREGIRDVLPRMDMVQWFWTASIGQMYNGNSVIEQPYAFYGLSPVGLLAPTPCYFAEGVRCVQRPTNSSP